MTESILIDRIPGNGGDVAEIILNAPKKLNALDTSMFSIIHHHLITWNSDDRIKAVIIRSNSEKAFSAGGDIRAIHHANANYNKQIDFFRVEYQVNAMIHHFSKPYIALLDGITMGGGAGVSLHGSHPIATERFTFAMPETGIGFFPDVGISDLLKRCPGEIDMYLALTGLPINASDAYYAGLVSITVHHDDVTLLRQAIIDTHFTARNIEPLNDALQLFHQELETSVLAQHQDDIDMHFQYNAISKIVSSLQNGNEWCKNTAAVLLRRSPTSLSITFKQQHCARELHFDDIIQMDFNLAHHFLRGHDFQEGVRAAVIDKDRNPQWQPAQLNSVSSHILDEYFKQTEALF